MIELHDFRLWGNKKHPPKFLDKARTSQTVFGDGARESTFFWASDVYLRCEMQSWHAIKLLSLP